MGGDVSGSLTPWVLSIGGGIVATLLATIGKLWTERAKERAEHRTEVEQLRAELHTVNAQVVELQREAQERSDDHTREHLRDLRRLAGLSSGTSGPWPAVISPAQRELIRGAPERLPPPPKKQR